jgi:hypothetical protein
MGPAPFIDNKDLFFLDRFFKEKVMGPAPAKNVLKKSFLKKI